MRGKGSCVEEVVVLTVLAVALLATCSQATAQETVLHSFGRGTDGAYPTTAGLVFDAAGNIYGTTKFGGLHNQGTVFELSPRQGGGYTETVLHSFGSSGTDGKQPSSGVILDAAGNLYGTTTAGGIHNCTGVSNCGTVYEMTLSNGVWRETLLHSFGGTNDGVSPAGALVFAANGDMYGTTIGGGTGGGGTVYRMYLSSGVWHETVVHNFGYGPDGLAPYAALIFDSAGNMYSTTSKGGSNVCPTGTCGTVFKETPNGNGSWTESVIFNFAAGAKGFSPWGSLNIDASGNLYGTTQYGGANTCYNNGCGTVFELSPQQGGGWTETVLYSFNLGDGGLFPYAGVTFDSAGNIYGTDNQGGSQNYGVVFELSPQNGGWTESVVHTFLFNGTDGVYPFAGLAIDASGNLYGTTYQGGIHAEGTVFEVTP